MGWRRRGAAAAVAPDAREGIAARRDRRRPGFTIRVSDDRRPAYLRWEPDTGGPDAQVPIADGIFTWPSDQPQLIGSRCTLCQIVTFPAQVSCPRCPSTAMEEHLLARRGRLWAWTTQDFPPPSPTVCRAYRRRVRPLRVGYVELGGEVRVEARLTEADPAR